MRTTTRPPCGRPPTAWAYGQYSVQEGEDGVRFNMTLGRDSNNRLFPMAMTQERFDAVTSQLEGRTLRRLKALYTLVDAAALDEETRKTLVEQYPLLAEQPLYVAVDDLTDRDRDDLEEAFAAAGYTAEDLAADNEALGIQTEEAVFPSFQIAVEYTLTDEGLNVRLPRDSIAYDDEHYTLFSIRVLEFFGADQSIVSTGSAEQPDPGYIFLPDGSGALIDIDATVSNRRPIISGTVYGRDAAVTQTVDERANEQYYLPVYGIRRNNGTALFAVIDGRRGGQHHFRQAGRAEQQLFHGVQHLFHDHQRGGFHRAEGGVAGFAAANFCV